jgi:hypothetical protein
LQRRADWHKKETTNFFGPTDLVRALDEYKEEGGYWLEEKEMDASLEVILDGNEDDD